MIVRTFIDSPEALANFRRGLTGFYAAELLQQAGGRLLVTLPVGVGKTAWIIHTVRCVAAADIDYDLVIVLPPRKDILAEIDGKLPKSIDRLVLKARPRQRCADLDAEWQLYEQRGCGQLARLHICGMCPRNMECSWPDQFGKRLRGKRVVLATQQYLLQDPQFVARIKKLTGARRVLTIVDESDLLLRNVSGSLTEEDLKQFRSVQHMLGRFDAAQSLSEQWEDVADRLLAADTIGLQASTWSLPRWSRPWAVLTQREGRRRFGTGFHFIGFDLSRFALSESSTRRRDEGGTIRFGNPPNLGSDFIIFSGSASSSLISYRLDPQSAAQPLFAPFENHRFTHPKTRFYNLRWMGGAAGYFPGNAGQILHFFAAKIAANIRSGKRTLLIARKRFIPHCAAALVGYLQECGVEQPQIITGNWSSADLSNPAMVPLISYGMSGVNLFERCHAAYCLTGFYVNSLAISQGIDDLDPTIGGWRVSIRRDGKREPAASVSNPEAAGTLLPELANSIFVQKEADVVLQAVGRVRPFTQPREIITFYVGSLPKVDYDQEFHSLTATRQFFGIQAPRQSQVKRLRELAVELRQQGLTLQEIANRVGRSERTISRYIPPKC